MLEQLMTELQPYVIDIVITIVGAVATYVGVSLKSIIEEKVNTEQKKKIVETTCRYVNQLYKDLEGPAKFQKAKDVILQQLDAKGIIITELELDVLIESTVNSFKEGYTSGSHIEPLMTGYNSENITLLEDNIQSLTILEDYTSPATQAICSKKDVKTDNNKVEVLG